MTTQLQDGLFYQDEGFDLLESPFSPWEYGLEPGEDSSHCWRGYTANYAIQDGQLLLSYLGLAEPIQYLRFDENGQEITQPIRYPPLNGVLPVRDTSFVTGSWHYHELNMPLDYTGTLTLCRLPRHQDDPDYWEGRDNPDLEDFEHVLQLILEKGRVIAEKEVCVPQPESEDNLPLPLPVGTGEAGERKDGTFDVDEEFLREWGIEPLPPRDEGK